MYAILKLIFKNKKVKYEDAAKTIKGSHSTFCEKINGNSDFTIAEARKLREVYFPELTLDEAFKKVELEE